MKSKFIVHNRALKFCNEIPLKKHFLPPTETKEPNVTELAKHKFGIQQEKRVPSSS